MSSRSAIRILPALLLAAGTLTLAAAPASAHAVPVQMVPDNGSCIIYSSGTVWIAFSERLNPVGSSLRVEHDETGQSADLNDSRVVGASGKEMEVSLVSPLIPGHYTVFINTLSLDDRHPWVGSIVFEKRAEDDPTGGKCTVKEPVPPVTNADPTAADIGLSATLFLSLYAGVGGIGFLLFVWDPLLRAGRPLPAAVVRLGYGRVMAVCLLATPVAALATAGIFIQTASRMAEGSRGASLADGLALLSGSSLGQAYIVRIALLAALALLVLAVALPALRGARQPSGTAGPLTRYLDGFSGAAPGRFRDRRLLILAFGLGGAAMATQSLTGHASVFGQISPTVAADIAHQIAVTLWVGGLIHLIVSIYPAIRASGDLQRGPLVYLSVSRFSRMATVAVPVIVVTGGFTAIMLGVDSVGDLFGTTYGLILAAKVALVLPVVALGTYQKLRLIPDVEEKLPMLRRSPPPNLRLGRFRRATQAEVALGVVVLLVTAFLSSTASIPALGPPRPINKAMWVIEPGDPCINFTLIVTPFPRGPGSYNFDIFVNDCAGPPLYVANASLVFVSPNASVPRSEVTLIPIPSVTGHPNHWLTNGGHRMKDPGEWTIYAAALNYTRPWSAGPTFKMILTEG